MLSTTAEESKRRRFRLSIRMMLLLVLAICLGLGWQTNKARQQRAVVAAVKAHGGWVHYDYEFVKGKLTPGRTLWIPNSLRKAFGDEYFQEIRWVSFVYDDASGKRYDNDRVEACDDVMALLEYQSSLKSIFMKRTQATDEGLSHLRRLTDLEELYMWDASLITDAGVENLKGLVNLRNIHLDKSRMTDVGFRHLAGMKKMKRLVLENQSFSDRGLATVEGMNELTCLSVGGSQGIPCYITDDGLKVVANLENLQTISLGYARVTDEGLKHLSKLKNLKILDLGGCESITDEGLRHLAGLDNLEWLVLHTTKVTDQGLEHLAGLQKLKLLGLPQGVSKESKERFKSMMSPSLKVW